MKKLLPSRLFLLGLIANTMILAGCGDDDLSPEDDRLTTGFVVVGQTEDQLTTFAQYFEEMPTGEVDITQGTAFQEFFPLSVIDGAMFMNRTDGSSGFAKISVNGNQQFVEDGIISTVSGESFVIAARDGDFGVFHDRNDPDVINTFNPSTMEVTGTIDMTVANAIVDTAAVRYQDFIFRGNNEIFAPMRFEAGGNVPNLPLARIDVSSGRTTEVAELEENPNLVFLNSSRFFFDESNNFYFFHAGNISFPTVSGAILRIPAGSNDYDPSYNFRVPEVNNPALIGAGSFLSTFNYYQNNIGYALINNSLDISLLELVAERGGVENFTQEDFNTVLALLFNSPTGAWVEVDVVNQTVTRINGLPPLSPFDASSSSFAEGVPHFAIANPDVNAYYRLDPSTGTVEKLFDMTGARIVNVFDLSQTVQ